jgi:hypothetical protein
MKAWDRRSTATAGGPEDVAIQELVGRIIGRWPKHKKDAGQMLHYTADISTLVKECGFGRVQAAVEAARTRCKFLPEPAELRELLDVTPAVVVKPREPAPDCCACGGSGWKNVPGPDRRVRRCNCEATAPKTKPEADSELDRLLQERIQALDKQMVLRPEFRAPGRLASVEQPFDPKAAREHRQKLRERIEQAKAERAVRRLQTRTEISSEPKAVQ